MDRSREEANLSSGGRSGLCGVTKAMGIVVAQYDHNPTKKGQLRFNAGDLIYIISKHDSGWWDGIIYQSKSNVQRGWFPRNYVKSIKDVNLNRKLVSMGSSSQVNQRPTSQDSRRNSLKQYTTIGNIHAASVSGSRRGSFASAGNLRRKSLSALPGHDELHRNFQVSHAIFSTSPSNTSASGSLAASLPLKADYQLDMSHHASSAHSRKPSFSPSMNSASSIGSHEAPLQSIDPLQKASSPTEMREPRSPSRHSLFSKRSCQPVNDCEITILSAGEVEMLHTNLAKQDFVPLWTPVLTTNKNLLYYNGQLNIYCTSLPLTGTPELSTKSIFPPDEHIVDLSERDFERNSGGNAQMLDLDSIPSTSNKAKRTSDSEQYYTPSVVIGSTGNLTSAIASSKTTAYPKKEAHGSPASTSHQHSTHTASPEGGLSMPIIKTIFSNPNVFHYHGTDIKSWTDLKNSSIYFLRASYNFFFKNNNRSFRHNLTSATTLIFYHRLACKLVRQKLLDHSVWKNVSKMHKKLVKLLFRINVNSILYFSSSSKLLVTPNDVKRISSDDYMSTIDTTSRYSSYAVPTPLERPDLRNVSTSTMTSLNDFSANEYFLTEMANRTSEAVNADPNSPRTSVPTTNTTQTSNMIIDEETGIVIGSLFSVIQKDFSRMLKLLNNLHGIISKALENKDTLPQIYPRFIKGSFDGNMWLLNNLDKANTGINLPPDFFTEIGDRFLHASVTSDPVVAPTSSDRQNSNGSSKTFQSSSDNQYSQMSSSGKMLGKNGGQSKSNKSIRYPLADATLILLREKLAQITSVFQLDKTTIANSIEQGKLVELTMSTYNSLKESTAFLNVVERLDLQFFLNLKRYRSNSELEEEYAEFCESSMINVAAILLEFYDLKQALHDITIRYVMDSQNLSLRDPFVFCPMRGELSMFSKETDFEMYQFMNQDRNANLLSEKLIMQDVEINDLSFLNTSQVLCDAGLKYSNIATSLFQIIEQLIVERENIINYVARMMNNAFLSILLKDEQGEEDDSLFYSGATEHRGSDDIDFQRSEPSFGIGLNAVETTTPLFLKRAFAEEVPWYLELDFEHELIYNSSGHVKGGTKDALIEYLTNHRTVDASFNIVMLTTFRSMFSTAEFLSFLSERFDLYPPEGLSYEEYNIWIEKKQGPIRMRVINILKLWLTDYWNDAYFSESLEELHHIVDLAILDNVPGAFDLKPITENRLRMRDHLQESESSSSLSIIGRPAQKSSKGSGTFRLRKQKLLDFEPFQFACQLTLDEHNLYSQINQFECLDRIWHKKFCKLGGSDNISNFITSSNHLTNFVSYCVVKENDIRKRVQVIEFFVAVSNHCYNFRNFSSMTAIVSGLYCSPVFRLKKTLQRLPKETSDSLSNLNTLMDSAKNFFRYRELLKTVHSVPCVPFFGVYLSDLTFTFTGNPDFLHNNPKLINFSKATKIVAILNEIMAFQKLTYKLKHFEDISLFLETELENIPSIEKQYELSLKIEPRIDLSTALDNNAEYTSSTDGSKAAKKLGFVRMRK